MTSTARLWEGVVRRLGAHMPAFALEAWIRPLSAAAEGEGIALLCPTPFHRDRIREHFLEGISRCLEQEAGREVPIRLALESGPAGPGSGGDRGTQAVTDGERRAQETPRGGGTALPARGGALPDFAERPAQRAFPYTFDTFVVGPSNALAREASFAVARRRQQPLDLLFLTSATGLGKTHLARAIVEEARKTGRVRALYASAESFTNAFTSAIRSRCTDAFKRRFRQGCDLLVLEDVQFLGAKRATQLELFHTLAHLLDAGARAVLTADRLPRDIEGVDPRLRSQMASGLVAGIEPPDAAVRREILRNKAARGGVRLPEDCLELLVEALRGSVRDLEAVLIQLVATASLLQRSIDLELTRGALHKVAPPRSPTRTLDPEVVIEVVAGFFRTTPQALGSRSRRREILVPRQLAMYLCRRYTDRPLAEIARAFRREHPAVNNAVRTVERQILERAPLRYQVEALSARLDALRRVGELGTSCLSE